MADIVFPNGKVAPKVEKVELLLTFLAFNQDEEVMMDRRFQITVDDPQAYMEKMIALHEQIHQQEKDDASRKQADPE